MKARFLESVLTFTIAFVVGAIVTLAWNFIVESRGTVDWGTTVRLAVILGIVIPLATAMREPRVARS